MPADIVQRCYVINLDRRPDRLRQWLTQLPDPWLFPEPKRFAAIDGRQLPTPPQWRCGNGAWGCYRSHLAILEQCLLQQIESYVVFEDDAGFKPDFNDHLARYVAELPDDWELAYLGGQNLYAKRHPPVRISDHVYRPYNVNRTHGFMVRGRNAMRKLYRHLTWDEWRPKHHIDHHLGRLTQRRYLESANDAPQQSDSLAVYVPDQWLISQLPSRSNICGRSWEKERFFNHAAEINFTDVPFFAVLGPHRSGSSCLAMVMHHLGVYMGDQLGGFERTGGGEAAGLASLCEKAMPFPRSEPVWPESKIVNRLKSWTRQRQKHAKNIGTVAGGKYPHLCRLVEYHHRAIWDALRIIAIDRPIEDSIQSLQSRSHRFPGKWYSASDDECTVLQRSLFDARERFIAEHPDVPVHRVEFARLLESPAEVIDELVDFLGIEPSDQQRRQAIAHVNPNLVTV